MRPWCQRTLVVQTLQSPVCWSPQEEIITAFFALFGFVYLFLKGWKTEQGAEKSTKIDLRNKNASCGERLSKHNILLEEFRLDYSVCKSDQRKDVLCAEEILHHLMDKAGKRKATQKKQMVEIQSQENSN